MCVNTSFTTKHVCYSWPLLLSLVFRKHFWPEARVRIFFPLLIVLITIYISLVNFKPGTWLSGWDTLHPEINFSLNFKKVIQGVWREEQGLGAIAGHSHIADLPRIFFLYLTSFVVPIHCLRYIYFFLTLSLGSLGVYFFLEQTFLKGGLNLTKRVSAFFGGVFYLLNLGTLQHFYVPFEMFATMYVALPWLFLFATKYLIEENKRDLLFFCLATFLSTPMAYAATLWYVYFVALTIYLFTFHFIQLKTFSKFKKILLIFLLILIINSYWLLPNIYFLATSAKNVPQAKINQLFSDDAFLHDKKYATFGNVALLKGFLFDWNEYREGEFIKLFDEWHIHLQNPLARVFGWILFGAVFWGVLTSIIERKKFGLTFLPLLLFSFVPLLHSYFPINQLFSFMRNHFDAFKEGLRFPWTKFSIILMFCYASYFSQTILEIGKKIKGKKLLIVFWGLIFVLLITWMLPVFNGNLISNSMKISLPKEYFDLFSWFDQQSPEQRIAYFPISSFRGWEYSRWGFEGAGFIWFGLKQPILVRDFDRWNFYNENYYWEISYALYSQNRDLFENVLEKYQINWLLVDGNVINPTSSKALYLDELEEMLMASDKISLAEEFGKIKIYQVNLETPIKDFVFLAKNLPLIGPEYHWNNYDVAYLENGNYLSGLTTQIYFPFRSLFTGRGQEDLEFEVEEKEFHYLFRQTIPEEIKDYHLEIPELKNEELILVDPNDLSRVRYLSPEIRFDGKVIEVIVPKASGYFSAEIDPTSDPEVQMAKNCDQSSRGVVKNEIVKEEEDKFLRLTSLDANNCSASFWLPNLPHKFSYLITAVSRHQKGKSLLFWLENLNARRPDIETYLPKSDSKSYFIQPPMEEDGAGYTLHFDNISIGREKTVNDLGRTTVNLIPFEFLTSLKLVSPQQADANQEPIIAPPIKVSHPNPSFYRIEGDFAPNQLLVLSQSFHPGWQAFMRDGVSIKRIKPHVLVNNWANGWILVQPSTISHQPSIILVFLPQLLEYFGFFLLLIFGCSTAYFLLKYR